jgi:signal transduction histidine kinase
MNTGDSPARPHHNVWSVFLVALSSLLLLMFLPGLIGLRSMERLYDDMRKTQEDYQRNQQVLFELSRSFFFTSVLIRDFLLDSSGENDRLYLDELQRSRESVETHLQALSASGRALEAETYHRLRDETDRYWSFVLPVFRWTPRERQERGTYFLRDEHRPRRQTILAIAEEIRRLNTDLYERQYRNMDQSLRTFRRDLGRIMVLALFIGVAVSGGSIWRIFLLERQNRLQQERTVRTGEELRHLSNRLMNAQEEERKAISRELHDEVGQKLTALRLELGSLDRLRTGGEDEFRAHLGEAKDLAEQSLRTIRDISTVLRPSLLDDLGLAPAIQRQARQFSRHTGIPATVHIEGGLDDLPERHRTCIFRIVQETLTNCARHSKASEVRIDLRGNERGVLLTVHDDGVGFDSGQPAARGLGLIGIEERVRELGGSMTMDTAPGKGMKLEVEVGTNGAAAA